MERLSSSIVRGVLRPKDSGDGLPLEAASNNLRGGRPKKRRPQEALFTKSRKHTYPISRGYPWEKWFSMDQFILVKGRDFYGRTDSMIQQVRNIASSRHYNVRIRVDVSDDGSCITITKRDVLQSKGA